MKKWGMLGLAAVLLLSMWGCLPSESPTKAQPSEPYAAADTSTDSEAAGIVIETTTAAPAATETSVVTLRSTATVAAIAETTAAVTTTVTAAPETTTTAATTTAAKTTMHGTTQPPSTDSNMVWVSRTGKRYHSNAGCSGMKNPVQIPLQEAQQRGLSPCKNCY